MRTITVRESFVGLLYEDGAFVRVLDPGKHRLSWWPMSRVDRRVSLIDMRERSLTIKGQEILTQDKVAIRVSLLVYFRVRDAQAAAHTVASYEDRIYEDVQLAARRFLASRTLDAILNDRNEISDSVRAQVGEAATGYGVEILKADVKDLVFPGNLREIMNQVLETERRAEARLIEARKQAEALSVTTQAENDAEMKRVEAERERARVSAEAEEEKARLRLEMATREAQAVAENPALLQLRRLETLRAMAGKQARFVIKLDDSGLEDSEED